MSVPSQSLVLDLDPPNTANEFLALADLSMTSLISLKQCHD
jgi:hypothetical protein